MTISSSDTIPSGWPIKDYSTLWQYCILHGKQLLRIGRNHFNSINLGFPPPHFMTSAQYLQHRSEFFIPLKNAITSYRSFQDRSENE